MQKRFPSAVLLILLVPSCTGTSGVLKLVELMSWVMDLDELDGDTWKEDPKLGESIRLTFPPHTVNCFMFTRDSSLFSERMFILFQESNVIPPIAIEDEKNQLGCRGFFIIADTLASFRTILSRLPRWSTHRMYCLIRRTDRDEVSRMLQDEVHMFADAEAALFIYGDWSTGFRLGQPIRKFERIENFTEDANNTWEINLDGYRNFLGREVRFSTANCSIFAILDSDGTKFQGIDWMVFLEMSKRMNLTLKYVKPLPGARIGYLINGTWTGGIIGNVFSGAADIAFCGNWIESSKVNTGIQISVPVQRMCINYLVPRPKRTIGNWYAIFSPFSGSLWALLGVTLLFVSCVLNLMSLKMKILLDCRAKFYESKSNALLAMFGILVQGSWPSSKGNHGPTRHIVTGWVVFGLLMSTSFSSTLVSHLAKPKFDKKPEGIKDLVDMGYIWTENTPFPVERLLNMEDSYNKKWADRIKIVASEEEKIEDLKKEKRVIIGTDLWGGFATFSKRAIPSDVLSGYETMAGCVAELYEGFLYRSGSPFNLDMDFYIKQLRESGLVGKYAKKTINWNVSKNPSSGTVKISVTTMPYSEEPLTMAHLRGIFEALLLGHAASLVLFICEIVHHKLKPPNPGNSGNEVIESLSESNLFEYAS
ncbi:hypothetical protein GE061_002810 [Apolygus lucorum]|uniref:Ionotropic glutamate receptor C-terminal domain-containing protein n=1 Tax=Apolygus lucorum TaxID=248454 RepID=A0A6A4JFB5_APOLU|nr:hypothetical protein GE061_002810 [Apolygus lucorum]